jgi:hypothetical protein
MVKTSLKDCKGLFELLVWTGGKMERSHKVFKLQCFEIEIKWHIS